MTNPEMAALVAPIDEAIFFPFYGQVNVTNAKFRWYKTGELDQKSPSFYAVCCPLPVAVLPDLTFLPGAATAYFLELPGGQEKRPRASFAGTRANTSDSVAG